jgi:hypothetical protein
LISSLWKTLSASVVRLYSSLIAETSVNEHSQLKQRIESHQIDQMESSVLKDILYAAVADKKWCGEREER